MKKMFNKKFLLILGSSITLLIVLSVAMIFLTKENVKTFTKEGYIIASGKEDASIKYYFDEGTNYKQNISSQLVFTDSSGEKVTVDTDNFMHYVDGGIKFLKNGVIMDLDSVNSTTVPYYNITDKSVLEYSKKSYFIETIDKTLAFNNIVGRISDNKYIFAGVNIKLQLAGNENLIEGDYFEVNFIENGVIKVENQEVSYQTTAENSYILVNDTIRIDLGTKRIYFNGEEKMSLSQMTIDGNENIEIVPEEDEETGNGEGDGTGQNSGSQPGIEQPNNPQPGDDDNPGQEGENPDNNENTPGQDGENTPGEDIETPEDDENIPGQDGEQGDNQSGNGTGNNSKRNATIDMTKAEVGANNISASFIINDPDKMIKGDLVLHITNTDTGKRVYSTMIDRTQPEFIIGVSTLSPDSNYILSINEENNEKYDTQYFQKLFKTDSLGIALEKKYVTQDSVAYEVIFEENTEVKSAKITLYNESYDEESARTVVVTPENNVAYFGDLACNTTYNIELSDVIMDTFEYNKVYTIYKSTKTLKQPPYLEGLTTSVDDEKNTFTIGIDRVVDDYESIIKYSYYIYKADDITQENIDTIIPVSIIEKNDKGKVNLKIDNEKILPKTNYKFKVVAEYFDNEKYGEFETELSDNFILSGKPTIEFVRNEEKTTFNKIVGTIILNDDSCTVPIYGRPCSSVKWYNNNFVLEYKIINSTEKVVIDNLKFNTQNLTASIEIDNLLANTEYVFNLYGDVDLLDGQGLREGYLIGTFRTSTSSIDILTVDTWKQNESTREDVINVSAKISSSGVNQNLGESIHNMTFNLYAGDTANQLKAGVVIEPIATKQVTGELKDTYYNKLFTINTLDTFDIKKQVIVDEETGTTTTTSAINILKSKTDGILQKYYTIEITGIYDYGFQNKIEIENNYYLFETPPLFLMEDQLATPTITADAIENLSLNEDKSLGDLIGTKYNDQLNDTTIVGYKVNATASIDRISNYFPGGQPVKELIYYVCNADTSSKCDIETAVETKVIDLTQAIDMETYFLVGNGTKYSVGDTKLTRGHNYIFKMKLHIDTDNDGVADTYYPNTDVQTSLKKTPKQSPSYNSFIISTTENKANYKFNYFDIDNALYEEVIYYTIDDELKNTILPPEESENPDGEDDELIEEVPVEPTEPAEKQTYSLDMKNCQKIKDPSTKRDIVECGFEIEGLSTDSVYTLSFRKALTKKESAIVDEKIGEYIFDGKFTYNADTVTFTNVTNENDNRLKIRINETTLNQRYIDRISAYEILLSANGEDSYTKVYPSDAISTCKEGETEYKCIIVDYANIKNFKNKDITVKVTAYYDSGIIDNIFTTSNADISSSLNNQWGYLLQKNNNYNKKFTRASYIHIRDNGSVTTISYPSGIYGYSKAAKKSIDLVRKIDLATNTFAKTPSSYNLTLFYANDSILTKDSGKNNQSINNKLLSIVDLGTTDNTFRFNSIIPKINVSYKGLVNGAEVTISPTGVNEDILKNEFKEEDGKYYLYLDIYQKNEETTELELYKQEKVEINLEKGSTIQLTKYMPNTTYYFEVSAYLLKEKEYKKTLLFDAKNSSSYVTKVYEFSSLAPTGISQSFHGKSAKYTSNSDLENDIYLKRELILTMESTRNIGVYDTRFEIYDKDNNLVLKETTTPVDSKLGYDKSSVKVDITPTEETIKNKTDWVFGPGYYTMKIFIETEVYDSDKKAELLVYETPITLEKLSEPTYIVEKTEGVNELKFKVQIIDEDKVIKDSKYCIVLLNSSQQPIDGITPTCNHILDKENNKLEFNKEITYGGLISDTLYTFKIYADVYTNNVDDTKNNREVYRNILVSTSTNYGVALGLVTAYGSTTSVTLSFDSGVNIDKIKKIEYTLFEQKDKETGAVAIKSETYNMGTDKHFSNDGTNKELVINPEGLALERGYSYSIDIAFWVEQGGKLVKLNNKNYNYGVKFR